MESFGRYIAVILTVGMLFFVLSHCCSGKINSLRKLYVAEKGDEFIEETTADGIITLTEWEKFCEAINQTGLLCEIELMAGVIVQHATESQVIQTGYQMTYDTDIKRELYEAGSYQMKKEMFFCLRIIEKKGKLRRVYFERARKMD